jgi:hypothetical protein
MVAWRSLLGLVLVLIAAPVLWAETYPLAEEVKAGDCCRYKLEMTLSGELRFYKDDKFVPVKLSAKATHQFPERVLAAGKNGLAERTARVYDSAAVEITVGGNRSERRLRKERSLIAAQRINDTGLSYSPSGPLTREEIEVLDHFDTLSLTGLLAGKAVAVGETWKPNNAVTQALCHFEGLTEQDVSCKLESVKDNIAHVKVTGTAQGIELGALVKVQVDAAYQFDLVRKRIVGVDWKQKDERDQGPASPASTVETGWKVELHSIEQPDSLSDVLVSVPEGEVPAGMLAIDYRDPEESLCPSAAARVAARQPDGRTRDLPPDGARRLCDSGNGDAVEAGGQGPAHEPGGVPRGDGAHRPAGSRRRKSRSAR